MNRVTVVVSGSEKECDGILIDLLGAWWITDSGVLSERINVGDEKEPRWATKLSFTRGKET